MIAADNATLYDPAQAEEYVAMLFRHVDWQDGQIISLLGIGEKGTAQEGAFKERQMVSPGFMGAMHGHLKRWAGHHVAGFIVPAVLHASAHDGKGGGALDKVGLLTAIILDIDSGDVNAKAKYVIERLGRPTMMVSSGGKTDAGTPKGHLYWLLSEPSDEIERVAALRKLLATKVGGDQSFGRATQVIRVPGSVHAKNGNASVCKIIDRNDVDYDLEELADVIEGMEPMPGLPAPTVSKLEAVAGMLDFTPRQDTAVAALHRDINEGGEDLTRWGEFSKVAGFNISEIRAGRLTPEGAYTALNGWVLSHMVPPWPQARVDQEFRALLERDIATHGPMPRTALAQVEAQVGVRYSPTPATWPLGSMIPPRPWLFGRWLQRGIVTAMIAPGGVGKSSLVAAMTLSMAADKPFLGKDIYGGPLRVWSWNLEDGGESLARGRIAASLHHGVAAEACGDRLYVDSGPEGMALCTAVEDRVGFQVIAPVMEAIIDAIRRLQIDVLIIDPFVSSHQVNENDNNKIDAVAKAWTRVAQATRCAVVLVHHSVKMHGERVTADSARGAGALNNAARMTLVLNRMSMDQADSWGIPALSASRYFSVVDDKHNLSAPEAADWFELVSVSLNNGNDIHEADSIGVVTRWQPPRAMDGVDVHHLFEIQKVISAGKYRRDVQALDWVGNVVARVLNIDIGEPASKKKINQMLNVWQQSGALKVENRKDEKSMPRSYVVVGHWVGDPHAHRAHIEGEDQ